MGLLHRVIIQSHLSILSQGPIMKTLHIHTTIDATGSAISLGSYWDCSGRSPVAVAWEYIGEETGLKLALESLRDEYDAEFMHVINRTMHR